MKERKIRWQTKGRETIVFVAQIGRHHVVLEEDRKTGEVTRINETFNSVEAWLSYMSTIEDRMHKMLWNSEAPPEREDDMFCMRPGEPYVTNLKHPVIAALMEDYRSGNNIPHGDQLSDRQRREFDRMAVEYIHRGVPKDIIDSMLYGK